MEIIIGPFDIMEERGFFSEITYLSELIHVEEDEAFFPPSSLELTFQLTCF